MKKILLTFSLLLTFAVVAGGAPADSVEGMFLGNGSEAKLEHVTVLLGKPFFGDPTWRIILSEEDTESERHPKGEASSCRLGDSLSILIKEDGVIVNTVVCHSGHGDKAGFQNAGALIADPFKLKAGVISARLKTDGEQDMFGDRWKVDLQITATLPKD